MEHDFWSISDKGSPIQQWCIQGRGHIGAHAPSGVVKVGHTGAHARSGVVKVGHTGAHARSGVFKVEGTLGHMPLVVYSR